MSRHAGVTEPTDKLLVDAFWDALKCTPIDKVSVKMVASRAGFNRTTFYEYFPDISSLIKRAEDELVNDFKEYLMEKLLPDISKFKDRDVIGTIVAGFDHFGERIFAAIGENGDPSFQGKLEKQLIPFVERMIGFNFAEYSDYVATCACSAFVSVMRLWIKNGRNIEQDKIISMFIMLIRKGTFGMDEYMKSR